MVLFNYSTKELTAKVVYYGPGLCGKTTNLQWIHEKSPIKNKGKMVSLATETDRTLFFDFLPIELGTIRGMKTRIQLYTVPGQVFYNATRRMVLRGADCVVFVADSQDSVLSATQDSLDNLRENLEANDIDFAEFPMVIQYNKRDLPNALPIEELNAALNPRGVPYYEAVAVEGKGVEDTLKGAMALVFKALAGRYGGAADQAAANAAAPPPSKPIMAAVPEPDPEVEAMFSPDSLLDSVSSGPPPATTRSVPNPEPEPAPDGFSPDSLLELAPEPAPKPDPLSAAEPADTFSPDSLLDSIELEPEPTLEPAPKPEPSQADTFSPDSLLDSIELEPEATPEPAPEPEPAQADTFSPGSLLESIELEPEATPEPEPPAAIPGPAPESAPEPPPGDMSSPDSLLGSIEPEPEPAPPEPAEPSEGFSPDSLLESVQPAIEPAPVSEADLEPVGAAAGQGETGLEELSLDPEPAGPALEESPLDVLTGSPPAVTDVVAGAAASPPDPSPLEELTGDHDAVTDDVLAAAESTPAAEEWVSPLDELSGGHQALTDDVDVAAAEDSAPEISVSPLEELTGGHPAVTDDVLMDVAVDEPSAVDELWAAPIEEPASPTPEVEISPWEELTGEHPVPDDAPAEADEAPIPGTQPAPSERPAGSYPTVTAAYLAAPEEPSRVPEPIGEVTEQALPVPSLDDLMEEAPEPAEAASGGSSDESPLDELTGSLFGDADELSPAPADPEPPSNEAPSLDEAPAEEPVFDSGFDLGHPAGEEDEPQLAPPGFEDSGEELDLDAEPEVPSLGAEREVVEASPEPGIEKEAPSAGDEPSLGAVEGDPPEAAGIEAPEEEPAEPVPAVVVTTQEATIDAAASVAVPAAFASAGAIQAIARPVAPLTISAHDTEITIPVEIVLGPGGTTQLNLNIRLSLNLKVQP